MEQGTKALLLPARSPVESEERAPEAVPSPSAGHKRDDTDLNFKDLISDSIYGQTENLLEGLLDREDKPSPAKADILSKPDDSKLEFADLITSSTHEQTESLLEGLIDLERNSSPAEDNPIFRADNNLFDFSPRHLHTTQKSSVLKRAYDEFTELITTSTETYNSTEFGLSSNIFREPTMPASHHRGYMGDQTSKGYTHHFSPLSNFESPASFVSAHSPASYLSADTPASFLTARSTFNSPAFSLLGHDSAIIESVQSQNPKHITKRIRQFPAAPEYRDALLEKGLLLPEETELNWSGKGQHVEYAKNEDVPLKVLSHLGASISASVDKVLCRRIALARKTMRCTRTWNVTEALREVEHLHKLRHAHIVQLVGSYLQGRNFSILIYPAADCHLGTFLEDTSDLGAPALTKLYFESTERLMFLYNAFSCLSRAIAYVHSHTTKHMDIKPANILVRRTRLQDPHYWQIYLADFGLSRSFMDQEHSQTDGPTARTPKYCAPEVYQSDFRGRSADIFSLGCVFLEMHTVLCGSSVQEFADFRREASGDESFHANLESIQKWVDRLPKGGVLTERPELMLRMVFREPSKRPTADDLIAFFNNPEEHEFYSIYGSCYHRTQEPYEVYEP